MTYNQPDEAPEEVFGDQLTIGEHLGALFHITVVGFTEHTFPKKKEDDQEPKPTKQVVCDIDVIAKGYLPESAPFEGKQLKNVKLSNVKIFRSLEKTGEGGSVLARIGQAPKDDHGNRAYILNPFNDGDDKLADAFYAKAPKASPAVTDGKKLTKEQQAKLDEIAGS